VTAAFDIGPVKSDERDAVLALLAQHRLPTDGLAAHWNTTYAVREAGHVAACAGLEFTSACPASAIVMRKSLARI
jgi:hypothetical protein